MESIIGQWSVCKKESGMKRIMIPLLVMTFYLLLAHTTAMGASAPPSDGEALPDMEFPAPDDPSERSYLGLSGGRDFKIGDVKADVVIIEIFSMYCPYCQREAPAINRLYKKIESNASIRGKIKLIGIGAGNSSFEVGIFKKKYHVPFPLIPDNDFSIYNSLGKVRTPYFIGVKINPDGTNQIIYSKLGALEVEDRFLELILKRSGLGKEGEK